MTMSKRLILFCDGTWNKLADSEVDGSSSTNVVRLLEATLPSDSNKILQIVQYIEGIGTGDSEKIRGGGFGYGFSTNVKDGYRFIVCNYEPGDEIFIIGFSRGGVVAICISAIICGVGIIKREHIHMITKIYNWYASKSPDTSPGSARTKEFRKQYTWGGEEIKFLGIWDAVDSVFGHFTTGGFSWIIYSIYETIFGQNKSRLFFHDNRLSSRILSAYHALAADERRWQFRPVLWQLSYTQSLRNQESKNKGETLPYGERWFRGVHCNVGGGYPATGLSDSALEWIAEMAAKHSMQIDLQRITNPPFRPNNEEEIQDSQKLLYRVLAVVFAKIPSYIWPFSRINKSDAKYIRWNGDYLRQRNN
jgi:uncharacterized protein (DUF2235 family)